MARTPTFTEFLNEKTSGEIFKPRRGQKINFDPKKNSELADEFFELITVAYSAIGGHAKITKPSDVFADPDWNWWEGMDLHGTPDFDLIMFGSKTRYGVKFAGVGHDGSKDAKRTYIRARAEDLVKPGFFIEVSGKIAEILIADYRVPQVTDQQDVEKVLGKKVEWNGKCPDGALPGEGWYTRTIGGHPHAKIMLGKPRV